MSHTIEKLYTAAINISTAGDNTIITAPGDGHYLAIDFIQLIPTSAVTIQFKSGSTSYGGPYPLAIQQVITNENSFANQDGVMTMANNSSFVINLSGAVQCGGFVRYRTIGN